ncbi:MAG TPA: hypothetical protein VHX16_08230 [Chloroflexota bacterium]|nr:hypothetical protein [Chloroflexota bacterium]
MPFLRQHGVYRFSITMRTPFAGEAVIARARGDGFDLFTIDEWATMAHLRVSEWTPTVALSSMVGQPDTGPTCWWIRARPLIRWISGQIPTPDGQ